ncbi:MAG: Vitamin B12 dependent methionine synthase activation subunit [Clostridiales bacterium]|nr:Vitamin B12 dependent methionine synthase activation subunit [Clostridiales bacterium]
MRVFHFQPPPFCLREALRYAGTHGEDEEITALMISAWQEAEGQLSYQVCCREYPLLLDGENCNLYFAGVQSRSLSRHLQGCHGTLLMGATVGVGIDRLIARYGKIAPARALMMQAIGAERIEALCDAFCRLMGEEMKRAGAYLRPRFSPGYGDVPLEMQIDIFKALRPEKPIGLTLNDSLLMSPSKSVTAIIGLTEEKQNMPSASCLSCGKRECLYRRDL